MDALSRNGHVEYCAPATKDSLLKTMEKCGVDKSVFLNVVTKEKQHENALIFSKELNSDRIISFGSVEPESVHALEYVWKFSDDGLKGMKLHPPLQKIDLDDRRNFPVFDLARALGLVLVVHAGYDFTFPEPPRASVAMIINVLKNFPGLKLVAAHMGGLRESREVLDSLAGKHDLYFDTAYTAAPWVDRALLLDIIRRHGAERVLFGSDFPWHLPSMEIDMIEGLDISREEKDLILGGNAERILGI